MQSLAPQSISRTGLRAGGRAADVRPRFVVARVAEVAVETKNLVLDIDPETWADLTQNSRLPVLVDYYTQWCGPCKMMAPHMEQLASEFEGKMLVAKVDCGFHDKKFAIAQGIKALPTFHIYHRGVKLGEITGAKVEKLRALMQTHSL